MRSIKENKNLKGKKVLIRVDFNVPINNSKILDYSRIENSFKTIDYVIKKGGQPILISHHGSEKKLSSVFKFLNKKYKTVFLEGNDIDFILEKVKDIPIDNIILMDNIRNFPEEENNSLSFAKKIAKVADLYVNEAFSVSHRKHASIVSIPKYLDSYFGISFMDEIKKLSIINNPKSPFIFILGGSKLSTKIPLLKKNIEKTDSVIIAGALLNTFLKVAGFNIGKSVSEDNFNKEVIKMLKNPKFLLPVDVVVQRAEKKKNINIDEVQDEDIIVDIGQKSIELISDKIFKAKTILWNGPTGWYEKGYSTGTKKIALAILNSKAKTVIGGGDTGAAIKKIFDKNQQYKNIFISSGGGATLDYLSNNGNLAGIKAIK